MKKKSDPQTEQEQAKTIDIVYSKSAEAFIEKKYGAARLHNIQYVAYQGNAQHTPY